MIDALKDLKRIRQETAPCTYMHDFDKGQLCNNIEKVIKAFNTIKPHITLKIRVDHFYVHYYVKIGEQLIEITQEEYNNLKEVLL